MALVGGLENALYEADSGLIHNCRVGETTTQLNIGGTAQVQPAGPATTKEWARATKNSGEWGLEMRQIGYCFPTGTAPTGFVDGRTYFTNVLSQAAYAGLAIGSTVNVDGVDADVVSKRREVRTPES